MNVKNLIKIDKNQKKISPSLKIFFKFPNRKKCEK